MSSLLLKRFRSKALKTAVSLSHYLNATPYEFLLKFKKKKIGHALTQQRENLKGSEAPKKKKKKKKKKTGQKKSGWALHGQETIAILAEETQV